MGALLSLSGIGREVGWGGLLFEAGRLLTFSAFRMGVYSRWALIRGWALIRINTVDRLKIVFLLSVSFCFFYIVLFCSDPYLLQISPFQPQNSLA